MSHQSVVDLFHQLARNEFGFFARVQSIGEVMCTDVETADCGAALRDVLGTREPRSVGPVAIIDSSEGDVVGLLEQSTILRCCPRYFGTLGESEEGHAAIGTNVSWLATRPTPHVSPQAPPLKALELMVHGRHECLLVYDDPRELLGVIRARDFARLICLYYQVCQPSDELQRLRLVDLDNEMPLDEVFRRGAQTARDIMRRPWEMCGQEPVAAAIKLMQENDVQHIPLLDEEGNVGAILTRGHVLAAMLPPSNPSALDLPIVLPPIQELLCEQRDPVLSEAATSLVNTPPLVVDSTCLLPETLDLLLAADQDVAIVQDDDTLVGIVTIDTMVRVLRTLLRLQTIKDD